MHFMHGYDTINLPKYKTISEFLVHFTSFFPKPEILQVCIFETPELLLHRSIKPISAKIMYDHLSYARERNFEFSPILL